MSIVYLLLIYAAGVATAFYLGWKLAIWHRERQGIDRTPWAPSIIVNLPQDYKPLETLEGKEVVVGERALLWWTVYKATLYSIDEVDVFAIHNAVNAADRAVDKVYGKDVEKP